MVGPNFFKCESSKEDGAKPSQTTSIGGSQISSLVDPSQGVKPNGSTSNTYSKSSDELGKSNRKRVKPGENPRPRPKDRQMIQDRMKELREIVPNGAKCSIDALLERTIKHMLFLQNVTIHAEKLKQNGMSEMLCKECGLFLEIVDTVRGLGLTILKGVIENRDNKCLARFAVEANRDVTRMDIFISLVHLLEQTVDGSGTSCDAFETENSMALESYHHSPSIAATVGPCNLK